MKGLTEDQTLLDKQFDRLFGAVEFDRDRRERRAHCSCAQANLAAGKKPHTRTFSAVEAKADGSCPHCGYYTVLMVIGDSE